MLQLVADRDIPSVGPRAPLPLGQPMDQGTFGVRGARATDSQGIAVEKPRPTDRAARRARIHELAHDGAGRPAPGPRPDHAGAQSIARCRHTQR